jgi:hypothetical protein
MHKKSPKTNLAVALLIIGIVFTLATGLVSRTHLYDPGTKGDVSIAEVGFPFAFIQVPTAHHIFGDTSFIATPNYRILGFFADIIIWSFLAYCGVHLLQKIRA